MKRFLHALLVVFCLSAFAGCATPSGKSVGEAIDDAAIVAKTNVEIINDPELKFFRIDVKSYRGVVTLAGRVESREQETRAVELAKKVGGVQEVRSTLVVSPK